RRCRAERAAFPLRTTRRRRTHDRPRRITRDARPDPGSQRERRSTDDSAGRLPLRAAVGTRRFSGLGIFPPPVDPCGEFACPAECPIVNFLPYLGGVHPARPTCGLRKAADGGSANTLHKEESMPAVSDLIESITPILIVGAIEPCMPFWESLGFQKIA